MSSTLHLRLLACLCLSLPLSSVGQIRDTVFTVAFDSDSDHLDARATVTLADIVSRALSDDAYRVQLYGHTDTRGGDAYNSRLSAKRVAAVRGVLSAAGLDEHYFRVASFGESRPKVAGERNEAHALNRRVEIALTTERIGSTERLQELVADRYSARATLPNATGGTVTGPEGASVRVPPRAFVYADGRSLPDGAEVEVQLEEATRLSSMVAHRLNTNGRSGRLRTGGMVRVTGRYRGEELRLRPGEAIDVTLPTAAVDGAMRLYVGTREASGAMDWALAEGELVSASTRVGFGGDAAVPFVPMHPDSVAARKALIVAADRLMRGIQIPRALQLAHVNFPKLPAFPAAFDPEQGLPLPPYVPAPPTRKTVSGGRLLKSAARLQREADEAFIADSLAYAQSLSARLETERKWRSAVARFRDEVPVRKAAHEGAVEEVLARRLQICADYVRLNHRVRAALQLQANLDDYFKERGSDFAAAIYAVRVNMARADPQVVMAKAYADDDSARAGLPGDTVGLSFAAHQQALYEELGVVDRIAAVNRINHRIAAINLQHAEANLPPQERERRALERGRVLEQQARVRQMEQYNAELASTYDFQIRTPTPQWHNCDHPVPPGEFQLLADRPLNAGVYFASAKQATVDFYPPGTRASVVYTSPEPVRVISYGVTAEGLKLAVTTVTPDRRQAPNVELSYGSATLTQVEAAIASLD